MKKLKAADAIARMIAGLPEVRILVEREEKLKDEAALQARMDVLEKVGQARDLEQVAAEALSAEKKNFESARSKFEAARASLLKADQASRDATHKRNHFESLLNKQHGEAHIHRGKYLLSLAMAEKRQLISSLRANLYFPQNGLPTRYERPGVGDRIKAAEALLLAIEGAGEQIQQMAGAALLPAEIKDQVDALLDSVGALPEVKEIVME